MVEEGKPVSTGIMKEYREFFARVMESGDEDRIRLAAVFYDWINDSMKETEDAAEKAFMFRSIFAMAKRLLDSRLGGDRLSRIGLIISNLRSRQDSRNALFTAEYLKLQLFEDCGLDTGETDWELVDKYLEHWAEASSREEFEITYYKRGEEGRIVADESRVAEAGPAFFRHCSAECVEWFYSMMLKPIDYTPGSLVELDRVIDAYWPKELFKDVEMEDEENTYSTILLRLVLMTGSYLGEVLVRNLGGKWEKAEPSGWHILLKESSINVFQIAEESLRGPSRFHDAFKLAEKISTPEV
ncbi:MAG: hypothetical protein FGF53_08465 [Candidatus Brockarchaeota archaeon]|nr:hypothetical protein [Candidatus Brockarchaeota archaeon]